MLSQLKSLVASAVTQDPIYDYTVDDGSLILCGRQELFRVKNAVEVSTGKEVSIFQIKLVDLKARHEPAVDTTFLLERLRQGVAMMSQLRHPGVLRVERGLVETTTKVWFVTERIRAWVPQLELSNIPKQVRVLGMRRCAETLRFFHETADLLMVDFSPASIFVASDGRWKVGDFLHAVRRTDLMAAGVRVEQLVCPPSGSWRSAASPRLDFLAAEFVDHLTGSSHCPEAPSSSHDSYGGAPALHDLMSGTSRPASNSTSPPQHDAQRCPLVFPDSDIYSFLLTTVVVLNGGTELFHCGGDLANATSQRAAVCREVDRYFPPNALLQRPRPPMSTVMATGPFATPDMRMLDALERYDTLESGEKLELLRSLYVSIGPPPRPSLTSNSGDGGGVDAFSYADFTDAERNAARGGDGGGRKPKGRFCESVIVENVLPLMRRESKQPAMLRFIVPILLQSGYELSPAVFKRELREYFTLLLSAIGKAQPPWFDKVGLLSELILEKFDVLQLHFSSRDDQMQILMPLLIKCLESAEGGSGGGDQADELLGLTLRAMRSLFESVGEAAIGSLLPARDGAAALAGRLVDVGVAHRNLFTPAFACLTMLLASASMASKETVEVHLVCALRRLGSADSGTGMAGAANDGLTNASEMRELQLQSTISMLECLESGFTREHVATKSLPLLAPLLLSPSTTVRDFTVKCMDGHLNAFRPLAGAGIRPLTANMATSAAMRSSDFFFSTSSTAATLLPASGAKANAPASSATTAMDLSSAPSAIAAGFSRPSFLLPPTSSSSAPPSRPLTSFSTSAPPPPPLAAPAAPLSSSVTPSNPIWSSTGGGQSSWDYAPLPPFSTSGPSLTNQNNHGGYGTNVPQGSAQGKGEDILSALGFM